jgi:hypothetical protein
MGFSALETAWRREVNSNPEYTFCNPNVFSGFSSSGPSGRSGRCSLVVEEGFAEGEMKVPVSSPKTVRVDDFTRRSTRDCPWRYVIESLLG